GRMRRFAGYLARDVLDHAEVNSRCRDHPKRKRSRHHPELAHPEKAHASGRDEDKPDGFDESACKSQPRDVAEERRPSLCHGRRLAQDSLAFLCLLGYAAASSSLVIAIISVVSELARG